MLAQIHSVLEMIAAMCTVVVGVAALFWPQKMPGFIGLTPTGPRGVTELRAVLGALFIALGATPLLFGASDMYLMLGITYLAVAVVRTISMFVDRSVVSSNLISIAFEVVLGVILAL